MSPHRRDSPGLRRRRAEFTSPSAGTAQSQVLPKEDFVIDLVEDTCTCSAGQVTRRMASMATRTDLTGRSYKLEGFQLDGAVCAACPLRPRCVAARPGVGRTVRLHPQEVLLQQTRALQQSPALAQYRYFGRATTKFQLYLASTVANLTLVAANADKRQPCLRVASNQMLLNFGRTRVIT